MIWQELMERHKKEIGYVEEEIVWHKPIEVHPRQVTSDCRCSCHVQTSNVRCTSCHMCDCYRSNRRDRN